MKTKLLILLVFVVFSCQKSEETRFSEHYEKETHQLLNQAVLPYLDTNLFLDFETKKVVRKVSVFPYNPFINNALKDSLIIQGFIDRKYFTQNEIDWSKKYRVKQWKKKKLINTTVIDTLLLKKVDSVYQKIVDFQEKTGKRIGQFSEDELNIFLKLDKEYDEFYTKIIGENYVKISSPYFNKNFDFAFVESYLSFPEVGGCQIISKPTVFKKENNVWKLLQNE